MLIDLLLGAGVPEPAAGPVSGAPAAPAGEAPAPFHNLLQVMREAPQVIENIEINTDDTGLEAALSDSPELGPQELPSLGTPTAAAEQAMALPRPVPVATTSQHGLEAPEPQGTLLRTGKPAGGALPPAAGRTVPPAGNELPPANGVGLQTAKALLGSGEVQPNAETELSSATGQRVPGRPAPAAVSEEPPAPSGSALAASGSRPEPGSAERVPATLEPLSKSGVGQAATRTPVTRTPLSLAIERSQASGLAKPASTETPAQPVAAARAITPALQVQARPEPAPRLTDRSIADVRAEVAAPRAADPNVSWGAASAASAPVSRETTASPGPAVLDPGVELMPAARQQTVTGSQRRLPSAVTATLAEAVDATAQSENGVRDSQSLKLAQALRAAPLTVAAATAAAPAPVSMPLMTLERLQVMQDATRTGRSLPPVEAAETERSSARQLHVQLESALALEPAALRPQAAEAPRAEGVLSRAENAMAEQALPQLARDVLRMAAQNATQLRLQLNPEELGALDVRLRVDGDRVHVSVVAQQGLTRELLEAQLPQLKSLLAEGGLELGDVDVRQHGDKDQPARRAPTGGEGAAASAAAVADADEAEARAPRAAGGRLIDAFA